MVHFNHTRHTPTLAKEKGKLKKKIIHGFMFKQSMLFFTCEMYFLQFMFLTGHLPPRRSNLEKSRHWSSLPSLEPQERKHYTLELKINGFSKYILEDFFGLLIKLKAAVL